MFLLADVALHARRNHGLWLAFIAYVMARAVALAAHYPALRREVLTDPA